MGYFSNGTEGMDYEGRYCARCVHNGDCAVWDAHMQHNYKECNNEESILHILIPRNEKGWNDQCKMFVAGKSPFIDKEQPDQDLKKTIHPAYAEWAKKRGLI